MKNLFTLFLFTSILNLSYGQIGIGKIKGDTVRQVFVDTINGGTISLFANNKYDVINGIDIGIITNSAVKINGLSIAPIYNDIQFFNGVVLGGITNSVKGGKGIISSAAYNNFKGSFRGVALTCGINSFPKRQDYTANGLIIGGLANNIRSGKSKGLILSSAYNRLGNNTKGVVISGIYNSYRNRLNGVSIAGIGNNIGSRTNGFLLATINKTSILNGCAIGLYNWDIGATGVKLGLVNMSVDYGSVGFVASMISNYSLKSISYGVVATGGVNIFYSLSGFAFGGIGSWFDGDFKGVAITAGANVVFNGKGLLLSGLCNYVIDDFNGLSISLINIGESKYQIGLINISKSSKIQVGLFNFNKKSKLKISPIFNFLRRD